jgi:hypothetical protein
MPYAEGRVVHDADSHVVETPEWFEPYADPHIRSRMERVYVSTVKPGEFGFIDVIRRRRLDPADRSAADNEIMVRKNWSAMGSFVKEDRPHALDLLGFASQLVFNTFFNKYLAEVEHRGDAELTYGVAQAHNRAMIDFCSVDRRLLAVGYVPLADFARARAIAVEAVAMGCKALMIPSACPPGHSPSHIELFPVWAVSSTSAAAAACSTRTTSRTACRFRPTFTAVPRTSARSTTWPSPHRRCRRWRR